MKRGETAHYHPSQKKVTHVMVCGGQKSDFIDIDRMYEDQCADICGR
jgi:hypothetical protein